MCKALLAAGAKAEPETDYSACQLLLLRLLADGHGAAINTRLAEKTAAAEAAAGQLARQLASAQKDRSLVEQARAAAVARAERAEAAIVQAEAAREQAQAEAASARSDAAQDAENAARENAELAAENARLGTQLQTWAASAPSVAAVALWEVAEESTKQDAAARRLYLGLPARARGTTGSAASRRGSARADAAKTTDSGRGSRGQATNTLL
eukprot:SAG22_NODE_724_length_7634_cov_11.669808_8_plen_211_part_00